MPPIVGNPTAPNETGVELKINTSGMAILAGNPIETSSGAIRAPGVPNPATPSINAASSQASDA